MKKALKVIAIIFGVLVIGFVIVGVLIIKKLPSPWEVKQAISPKKAQSPEFVQQTPAKPGEKSPSPNQAKEEAPKNHEEKIDDSKARTLQVLKDDFMNEQKPLSTVCNYLNNAEKSQFLRKDDSGSANEFMKSLESNQKDPVVESAASLFRYIFRVDGMRELFDMIEKADAEHDQGLFKKAEFYTKLGIAGQNIRSNKANIDRILMKSYNLYTLSRVVGRHPELARDPATLSFCEQIEKNINLNLDFNPDEQAAELQKFLDYAKVDPKEVDFDPNYRSNVDFNFKNNSLQLTHTWIEKLFAKDIEKAKREINKEATTAAPDSTSNY
ncbi:MAG: hypothetical protein JSU04_16020 [Bdellovibrionales bacterium]|nr:hypothetical protein [Bdellovibrionales bacterium]